MKNIEWIESCTESDFLSFAKELDLINEAVRKRILFIRERDKKNAEAKALAEFTHLSKETEYLEPVYSEFNYDTDEMEDEETPGSCIFTSEEQANDFITSIRNQSSYYYAHVLKWTGTGKYIITPSWKYDCSGEVIYTATYSKEEV